MNIFILNGSPKPQGNTRKMINAFSLAATGQMPSAFSYEKGLYIRINRIDEHMQSADSILSTALE